MYFSTKLEVYFDRARVMFRTCSSYVSTVLEVCFNLIEVCSTVLEVCFDRARGMFRPSREVCFDHTRVMFSAILEICFDRPQSKFQLT